MIHVTEQLIFGVDDGYHLSDTPLIARVAKVIQSENKVSQCPQCLFQVPTTPLFRVYNLLLRLKPY